MALLGIDEVGRGPWAGPLVMGAVILDNPTAEWCQELTDSKKLSAKKREKLNKIILEKAATTALGWVSSKELDEIGLAEALKLATRRAVEEIEKRKVPFDSILIDGTNNFLVGTKYEEMTSVKPKADLLVKSVSAASIIAKVARDNYMIKLAEKYPQYGFEKHVGYGTKLHREALAKYGPCPEHRCSFKPVRELDDYFSSSVTRREAEDTVSGGPELRRGLARDTRDDGLSRRDPETVPSASRVALRLYSSEKQPSSSKIGFRAETVVAEWLQSQGHIIVARNHKTKFYEIDIVSICNQNIYFTEVKYRKTSGRGTPLESITPKKQQQMHFAAESFLKYQPQLVRKYSPVLAAASVSGPNFHLDDWFMLEA